MKIQKYCSRKCSDYASRKPIIDNYCLECHELITAKDTHQKEMERRKFCSHKCCGIYRKKNPNIERNKKSSERMKKRNPMHMEGIKEKVSQTLKNMGHKPKVRGGNGQPMPVPQRMLLAVLGEGWYAEHAVPTKMKRGNGYPTCYKIDIAHPKKKIAIEVDGTSHCSLKVQARDKKKEKFLQSLGWKTLRFKNEDVMCRVSDVLEDINNILWH